MPWRTTLELIQCNSLHYCLLEMHEPPDCTHTCCTPETPHSRSCKGNSWAVWEFYKHQHLLFWLLYSYSMCKPFLIWKENKFSCLLFIHFVIWNFFTITYGVSLHSTVNAGTSWNFWWYSFYNAYLAQVFQMNTVCSTENTANAHYNNLLLAIQKTLSVSCFSTITRRRFQLSCLQELTDCIFQCSRRW